MKPILFLSTLSVVALVKTCGFDITPSNAQGVIKSSFEYIPSPDRVERSQRIENSFSRCVKENQQALITLLAPSDHIGTTISGHPTFFWYVRDISSPVRFTLVKPKQIEPVIDISLKADKLGLFKFTLPPNIPELEMDTEYRWSVGLVRNLKRPSVNPYAYAWIKRVSSPPQLEQKLSGISSRFDRSAVYASLGIWHDTLATIHRATTDENLPTPQSLLPNINSGKSIWLINKIPIANYVSVSKDSIVSRGSGC